MIRMLTTVGMLAIAVTTFSTACTTTGGPKQVTPSQRTGPSEAIILVKGMG